MINTYLLSNSDIDFLLNQSEVISAKQNIDKLSSGSINFTINLNDPVRQSLFNNLGLDLTNMETIPMRWIKGDTKPHIDRGSHKFDTTYLAYLTDSPGKLVIDNESYPISKGNAYVFSEGLSHETVGTGYEPRLLLGPMSEQGISVGGATTIQANGETQIIYIRYDDGSGTTYKINNGSYNGFSLPLTIENTNPVNSTLQVLFETDIVLGSNIWYIICGSASIQFGSSTLNGNIPIITIDGVPNYPGFIQNGGGFLVSNGWDDITVQNIGVKSINGSTLADQGGWVCQNNFARGASNNNIINCYSTGYIVPGSGGIVGTQAASYGGSLNISKCFSTGFIDNEAGGILGNNAAYGGSGPIGTIAITNCYSTGVIGGTSSLNGYGGGIVGSLANNISISNCYSLGEIVGDSCGGIIGNIYANNSSLVTITNCYSMGNISGYGSGGIASSIFFTGTAIISNCYTTGSIAVNNYGIAPTGPPPTVINCYSENGSGWNDINANNYLTGVNSGTWTPVVSNSNYLLSTFNQTLFSQSPYTSTNSGIFQTSPGLIQSSEPGFKYVIYGQTNANITIDTTTGVISFLNDLQNGTYTVNVFCCIDPPQVYYYYNINTFVFTKNFIPPIIPNAPICFLAGTPVLTDQGEIAIEKIDTTKHTIRGQKIVAITESIPDDSYLVCIEKNSLSYNVPNRRTIISKDHKIMCDKTLVRAEYLIQYIPTIYRIPYNKERLYNVLLKDYSTMSVNNLLVETMNPNNILAKIYSGNYTTTERNKIIKLLNKITARERKRSVISRNIHMA